METNIFKLAALVEEYNKLHGKPGAAFRGMEERARLELLPELEVAVPELVALLAQIKS